MSIWQTITSVTRLAPMGALALMMTAFSPDPSRNASVSAEEAVPLSPRATQTSVRPHVTQTSPWTRTSLALGLTLGIVVGGAVIARKFMPGLAARPGVDPVHVLCQTPLGPRGTVYLLRCGPRVLVIGATASQLTTLAEISDPDEIDQLEQASNGTPTAWRRRPEHIRSAGGELKGQLHGMLDKIDNWNTQG